MIDKDKYHSRLSRFVAGYVLMFLASWPAVQGFTAIPQLQITIEGQSPYFQPVDVVVVTGFTVRWNNPTGTHHTITHDACVDGGLCLFDSGVVAPQETFTLTGLPPGQYPYHCQLHPIMRGVLTVVDQDASTARPLNTPSGKPL